MVEASKRAKPWRQDVMHQTRDQYRGQPLTGPVSVEITFWLPRPQSHYRIIDKQLSNVIKANAPVFSTASTQGDIDKVLRCTLDGLQAKTGGCVLADDSLVVRVVCEKRYVTETQGCGAFITVVPS